MPKKNTIPTDADLEAVFGANTTEVVKEEVKESTEEKKEYPKLPYFKVSSLDVVG